MSIRDTFDKAPRTAEAIIYVVNLAKGRLDRNYRYKNLKIFRICYADPVKFAINYVASKELSPRGCRVFHRTLKTLEKKKKSALTDLGDSVDEDFSTFNKV
jgi:hypothetical protein